jgi:hypothetical protein
MRWYVDGCSYTAGHGLNPAYSLASIISRELKVSVVDNSRTGKSNYAMALDLYSANTNFDYYVIGWTYHSRFEFQMDNVKVDSTATRDNIFIDHPAGEMLENEYKELQPRFFKYASRLHRLSDYLVDSSSAMLSNMNKKFCYFSWERRIVKTDILYPRFEKEFRQNDTPNWKTTGHLTTDGMEKLAKIILDEYDK